MRRLIKLLAILLILSPITTFAQEKQLPIEAVDQFQKLEHISNSLDQLQKMAESIVREKYYKCMKSFGDDGFCQCLSEKLPIITTFENYISIVTSDKEELGYMNLKDDDKEIVDLTYKTRETCVNKTPTK